jgi:pimeloyl-ACP methyl ester carboxylesterase
VAEAPALERVNGFKPVDGIPLQLHRMPKPGRPPVLLLHGASAQHETFCIPRGRSLAKFLWDEDYDPWLLDWRGSRNVTDAMGPQKLEQMRDVLDLDRAASEDIPAALRRIASVRDREDRTKRHKIHVIGHCLGAAVLAQAIADDNLPLHSLGRVVLLTIGLFYEPPLDGKMKSQFNVLDRLWKAGSVSLIDPREPAAEATWPPELRDIYQGIGPGLRPHPRADGEPLCSHALCNRVSFMYGVPFRHSNLVGEIHGVATVKFTDGRAEPRRGERLQAVFKKETANEAGQLVHRRSEAPVERPGVGFVSTVQIESGSWHRGDAKGTLELNGSVGEFPAQKRQRKKLVSYYGLCAEDQEIGFCDGKPEHGGRPQHDQPAQLEKQFGGIPLRMYFQGTQNVRRRWAARFDPSTARSVSLQRDKALIGSGARKNFHSLPAVTLITGAHNQLWHRDSINRMYEWLTRGLTSHQRQRFQKVIFRDYGHQDLLWGKSAWDDVFPTILEEGLGGRGASILVENEAPQPGPHLSHSE